MKLATIASWIVMYFILFGCESRKVWYNKEFYDLKQSDTLEIYYSVNSCCYYCITRKSQMKHIVLLRNKAVSNPVEECEGCNQEEAFVFKAISKGTDTIYIANPTATQSCESSDYLERYIVNVQ